jgi:hypothetical protein
MLTLLYRKCFVRRNPIRLTRSLGYIELVVHANSVCAVKSYYMSKRRVLCDRGQAIFLSFVLLIYFREALHKIISFTSKIAFGRAHSESQLKAY